MTTRMHKFSPTRRENKGGTIPTIVIKTHKFIDFDDK